MCTHLIYIDVCTYIYIYVDQICNTYVRYITHEICSKLQYIYICHAYYIHPLYTHMHTHRVLYVDFTHKFSGMSDFKTNLLIRELE